ncbi:MAG: PEP-CTERM sorting domain-containing protein [Pseudanabaenales cyanobacterium]|nr:PEP-CTERM sorting domain-containing protein [Pseudanabaenales cyanobacterium]
MKKLLAGLVFLTTLGTVNAATAATLFRANLEGSQVVPSTPSSAGGFATFTLNDDQTALEYFIQLDGLTLKSDISERTQPQDVTKIHLHVAAPGANGPHVLNIFGLPSEDDGDLKINFATGALSGIWNDSDVVDLNGNGLADPNETKPLTAFLDELFAGQLYVQVHTVEFDTPTGFPGELRGQISAVPEPSTVLGMSFVLGAGVLIQGKKKQRRDKGAA